MILRRLGNKKKMAKKIQSYFPPHKIYIEPFFGAGGMFFNKPKVKYNFLNDLDSDVFNLFSVLINNKEELIEYISLMPEDQNLFNYWKDNKEVQPTKKALRFLMLSNFSWNGLGGNFRIGNKTDKKSLEKNLLLTYDFIINSTFSTKFLNFDFRLLLKNISFVQDGRNDELDVFTYSDPPYLSTSNNYNMESKWAEKDVSECMDMTFNSGFKGAMSEFDNEFVINEAKKRGLNVIVIGERKNLKNRRAEILITNYKNNPSLFDGLGCL